MTLEQLSWLAPTLGAPTAIVALVFAGLQLRRTLLIEQGRFLLELERMSAAYDKTHLRLRPGGDWADGATAPANAQEWAELEDYMGFFEHCELLIEARTLQLNHFRRLFGYRVRNIVNNKTIVQEKLVKRGADWTAFRDLAGCLGITLLPVEISPRAGSSR